MIPIGKTIIVAIVYFPKLLHFYIENKNDLVTLDAFFNRKIFFIV